METDMVLMSITSESDGLYILKYRRSISDVCGVALTEFRAPQDQKQLRILHIRRLFRTVTRWTLNLCTG